MSIGSKLIRVSLFSLGLLLVLVITGWLGFRAMDASSREAEALRGSRCGFRPSSGA